MRALVWVVLSLASALAFAEPAGTVTLLTGKATAMAADGAVRNLSKGAEVNAGEVISSGSGSYVNLKFRDGGLILLRPDTRFQIEQYAYAPKAPAAPPATPVPGAAAPAPQARARPTAFFRLLKGGLRTVTGLIGKVNHNDYRLATPTATIGIRGTQVFAFTCNIGCSKDPAVLEALKNILGDKDFSFDQSDIIGTVDGKIIVTNGKTGETSDLPKGQYLISTTTDEGNLPLNDPDPTMGGGGDLLKMDPKNCK